MGGDRGPSFRLEDYAFDLPPELIAQRPEPQRDASRLLVLDRSRNCLEHSRFDRIQRRFQPGDLLVVNNTRVVPARLRGFKESGGRAELLVLDPYKSPENGAREGYLCLVKTSKHVRCGLRIALPDGIRAEILEVLDDGKARVRFYSGSPLLEILDRAGEVPLPPYIARKPGPEPVDDTACYQTVYARNPGAVAAPTAGLHFSTALMENLRKMGVEIAAITLHVGYGTFAPVRCEDIRDHRMHSEYFEVDAGAAGAVSRAKNEGRRVVAVGTTVVRTLEWLHARQGEVRPFRGLCDHYIYPGYRFSVVDTMITNFHLPGSSLILLVSAFAGRDRILSAYAEAVRARYRFFSYGDAMLIV